LARFPLLCGVSAEDDAGAGALLAPAGFGWAILIVAPSLKRSMPSVTTV
jgi:hypothetical protein